MLNSITKLGFLAVLLANWAHILRALLIIMLYFVSERIFERWLNAPMELSDSLKMGILIMNTLTTLALLVWLLHTFRQILWIKSSKKALQVDKSIKNMPPDYEKIKSIKLKPKLKKIE